MRRPCVENLAAVEVITDEEIQELGEDMATDLGRLVETRIRVSQVKTRWGEHTMTQKEPDEKELLEILELPKSAEQKAREMSELITAHTEKWQRRAEAKRAATAQK